MINFNELKIGDRVVVEFENQKREGEVTGLDWEDKLICVQTEIQDFWYEPEHVFPIELSDEQLIKFGFEREANPDGSVKYKKDAFRILLPSKDHFSSFEIWYREDRRHISHAISVHELQNHYAQMTKVELAL